MEAPASRVEVQLYRGFLYYPPIVPLRFRLSQPQVALYEQGTGVGRGTHDLSRNSEVSGSHQEAPGKVPCVERPSIRDVIRIIVPVGSPQ